MSISRAPLLRPTLALLAGVLLSACASNHQGTQADAAPQRAGAGGWVDLLADGSLGQWRGYRRDTPPASWTVQEGVLAFAPSADREQRGDLMTREQFGDFELELEWRISEGGNSGIIYRAGESEATAWRTGPEMQVLDDERHADGKIPSHRAGALYDLIVPPANITRPVGEWNRARLVVRGGHIQQWLNGHKTADIVVGSDAWNEAFQKSKFRDLPNFARLPRGHILLQDHNDRVWYRNIRVRPL